MSQSFNKPLPFLCSSIGKVFSLFLSQGRRSKKTKLFFLIGFLPVIISIAIRIILILNQRINVSEISIFTNIIMFFYLQFLILILALFFGTSICSDEIEGKTLTYLTTRPIPKTAIILGKYAAYVSILAFIVNAGMILSFIIININSLMDFSIYKILFRDMGVLTLGLVCYTAFFTLVGTFLKKSILFGLVFSFGWENVIQYFPGSTQRFVIAHYLKSLLPQSGGRFSFLMFQLEPTSAGTSIVILLFLTVLFLFLASIVFTKKEYILEN